VSLNVGVKEKRCERERNQRDKPEVKAVRSRREHTQRDIPEVKAVRSQREHTQRDKPEVKAVRSQREHTQRDIPEVKAVRSQREHTQRDKPEVKAARSQQQTKYWNKSSVKAARSRREHTQRDIPVVKAVRRQREHTQRDQPEVKVARSQQLKQHRKNPVVRATRHLHQSDYIAIPGVRDKRNQQRLQNEANRISKLQDIDAVIKVFCDKVNETPKHTCTICERFRFRTQVQKFNQAKYQKHSAILDLCNIATEVDEQWICIPCHQSLTKGKMPPLSVVANNLKPINMPGELNNLNTLEQFLITPVLPFMKIISLPKGSQRGMHGPVVCVASEVTRTVQNLPRPIDDSGLLKVKLKRKLAYKGHHLYQQVRMNLVADALHFLKQHHPAMKGKFELKKKNL
jgi:hypothetical protein